MKGKYIMPLVSILVPSYNQEKFVKDCIESILSQDYQNIELLVCDDCSSDDTFHILQDCCSKLSEKLAKVVIMQNDHNLGLVGNCNKLLQYCQGDFIKIIAGDDMLLPRCISSMVAFLESHLECDLVYSKMFVVMFIICYFLFKIWVTHYF